ncbi:hypothetical protein [Chloroflexus sp.]|uniref:hypothetical protein n=1 Tax=Chloroflexus sp. TaxID=1904827 RepID=UPI002ADE534C|nr:hypothetical protein [Chloroflexus sp.]
MNAYQLPTTAYPDPGTSVWQRAALATAYGAITRWVGFLARSSGTCRGLRSAVATLTRQSCSQSGAWHAVDPAGHGDAMYDRHDHSVSD